MKKKLLFIIPVVVIIGIAFYFFRYPILATKGILEIETNPKAVIFINDEQAGTTPFKREFYPQELKVKIFPVQENSSTTPIWQGTVKVNPLVLTLIRQDFTEGKDQVSGEILTLNKIPDKDMAALKVTSYPNKATVILDGKVKGYTPLLLKKIEAGQHTLELSFPNHQTTVLGLNMNAGYRLDSEVKLVEKEEEGEGEGGGEEKEGEEESSYVQILSTPTGWLRVRQGAGVSFPEIARIKPEEEYLLLEEKNGWFKIQLDDEQVGWISGEYAAKPDGESD